jgi:uncharacterized protein (DUF2147 family)
VRITEQGGAVVGSIDKLLDPTTPADAKCDKCQDDRKNQPVVGLQIIRGVKADGDGIWTGGEILDPNNGKTYRARLKPVDGGRNWNCAATSARSSARRRGYASSERNPWRSQ